MTYEERNTCVAILISLMVNTWIAIKLYNLHQSGVLVSDTGLLQFARTVLWAIPASIVLTIVLVVLFNILFAIATRQSDPDFTVDERDQQFKVRGLTATTFIASAGFIIALVHLAIGYSSIFAFLVIYAGFALGDFVGNVIKLASYREVL